MSSQQQYQSPVDHHPHKDGQQGADEAENESQSFRKLHSSDKHYHNTADTIRRLRLLCLFHGAHGILDVGRLFRKLDDNGSRPLNLHEFKDGLLKTGLDVNDGEVESLFRRLDHDRNGRIDVGEFLAFVRPPLAPSRLEIVEKAFKKLDPDAEGSITLDALKRGYNVKNSTKYLAGEESEIDMVKKFLINFEHGARADNKVTHEEFLNYYSAIGASIDDDCFFDLMMRQFYKL